MSRNNRILLLFLIPVFFVLTTGLLSPQEIQQIPDEDPIIKITQLDTSLFPVVTAYISITNSAGEPLAIDPDGLVITENEQIIQPDKILGKGEVGPLTTILAIDTSGSMLSGSKLKIAKIVAADYVSRMGENDQAGIVAFSDNVRYVQEITGDKNTLENSIKKIQATGDTAMYDGAMQAVEILNPLPGRKAIILLTDGMDNRSKNTPEKVMMAIGQKGLSISTIGFGDPNQGTGNVTALDEKALVHLAKEAGGEYGFADDEISLKKIYEKYNRMMRSEYIISYTSPSALRDGLRRDLIVTLGEESSASNYGLGESSYNPGGLVPELGGEAPWKMFFLLLGFLLLLLLIPAAISFGKQKMPRNSKVKLVSAGKSSRVKLK